MTLEKEQLEAFVAVAELRQLRAAARRLGKSPAVLSRHVRKMERRLGVPLFTRTPTGMFPTAAATAVLDRAIELVELHEHFLDRARAARGRRPDVLVLRYSGAVPSPVLGSVIAGLRGLCGLTLRVDPDPLPSAALGEEVAEGRADLAVCHLPVTDAGVRSCLLLEYQHVLAVPVHHPLGARESVTAGDLVGEVVGTSWGMPSPHAVQEGSERLAATGIAVVDVPEDDPLTLLAGVLAGELLAVIRHPRYGGKSTVFEHQGVALVPVADRALGGAPLGLVWGRELMIGDRHAHGLAELVLALGRR